MADSTKSKTADGNDLDAVRADIEALRKTLANLAEHAKDGALSNLTGTVDGLTDEASKLYGRLAAESEKQAEALAKHVEERPLTSLLIAFLAGVVGGKLFLR